MATLLHIDASLFPDGASASRAVTTAFSDAWRAAHPEGTVVHRDLAAAPLPHLDATTFTAAVTDPATHTEAQAAAYAARVALVEEAENADVILIAAPMYNFGVASSLKAWLDHIIFPGRTLGEGTQSLAGKRVVVVASRGGSYEPGTPREEMEFVKNYLAAVLAAHLGITPEFITIELTLAPTTPAMADLIPLADASRASALATAAEKARELAEELGGKLPAAV
ncbi:NAD(P)H-dependent oxidoreductase [Catenulispora yoronensis]|uniref:FMN dependent NADH:quinone oxidoreductase n=1 Tax=Catenulispora yoronensis TaxID=450799 RepID=A0ABN2V7U8_9ACTN